MNILLAIDGSPCSDAAVRELYKRPWPSDSTVKVVTAILGQPDDHPQGARALDELLAKERRDAFALVAAAAEEIQKNAGDLTVETAVLAGHPKSAILEAAEEWPADLILVGSHGYNAVKRFLLGSVSHAIALHAPCSVGIIRCRETEAANASTETQ